MDITNSTSQGSVIGLVLFNIFNVLINDLEMDVTSGTAKFADHIKLFRMVKTIMGCKKVQTIICALGNWGPSVQVAVIIQHEDCKVMDTGAKNGITASSD